MTLTFGSLFAGIGGMDLGLERAGMVCRWQVEIDDYCRRVLAKHWADVPRYGDIREVTGGEVERVDLLCGGFPCQDISNAGKREGLDGARSGLWSEYVRLIRVLRPRYVLVENVSALLGRGIDRVLGDLAACGYDAEWDCIPAAAVGAPHLRDRVFVVAYPQCGSGEAGAERSRRAARADAHRRGARAVVAYHQEHGWGARRPGRLDPGGAREPERALSAVADADGLRQPQSAMSLGRERHRPFDGGQIVADAECQRRREGPQVFRAGQPFSPPGGEGHGGWWESEPDVGRVAHGVPARVDRLRGLGNAVVPQVAQWVGERILAAVETT
jgi:DNA (cytosine-5)-methyltransferase 1